MPCSMSTVSRSSCTPLAVVCGSISLVMERFCKYEVVTSKVATLSVRAVGTGTKWAHGPGVKVRKSVKNPDHFRRDEG